MCNEDSGPQFAHLETGHNDSIYLTGLLGGMMTYKALETAVNILKALNK